MPEEINITSTDNLSSSTLGKFALALSKAQGEMENSKKSTNNPFFHSKYADLASVYDVIREPLSRNELAVIQSPGEDTKGLYVETKIVHSSGEWMSSRLYMNPIKLISKDKAGNRIDELEVSTNTPQARGSAITYARRYALQSMIGIGAEDDDGNKASGNYEQPMQSASKTPIKHPAPTKYRDEFLKKINTEKIDDKVLIKVLNKHSKTPIEYPADITEEVAKSVLEKWGKFMEFVQMEKDQILM